MANLSTYYPLPIVSGTTLGTFADGASAAHVGQANTYTQNQTLDGTNNTAPNQTAASGSSVMTRDLVLPESLWQAYNTIVVPNTIFGGQNNSGTAGANSTQIACRSGSAAAGWGRSVIQNHIHRTGASGGVAALASIPIAVGIHATFVVEGSGASGAVCRLIVGGINTGAPPFSGSDAISGRGFGAEFYWSTANNQREVRLFAHDGTTYSASSGVAFNSYWPGASFVLLSSDGAGNIKLHGSTTGTAFTNLTRPTLLLTHTGGPTGANTYAANGVTVVCVNDGTNNNVSGDALFNMNKGFILSNYIL